MSPSPSSDHHHHHHHHKSLTPQRKHRKMLKDGTSEVWPESVEQIFVQGLREYWESPWATYSRGRSRWRNQFLVDYLRAAGIHRSKKQVASHIQVLRNMWKGEPEYQLVAGGEELFQDSGSLAPADMKQHSPDSVSSDVPVKEEQSDPQMPLTHATPNTALELNQFYPRAHMPARSPVERLPDPYLSPLPLQSNAHASVKAEAPPFLLPDVSHDAFAPAQPLPRNGLTGLTLFAEGMHPLVIDVNRLAAPARSSTAAPPRICLRIKLALTSLDDVLSPPTLHGFQGTVTFAAPWTASAQCVTRVYAGTVCESEEVAAFAPCGPNPPAHHPVSALLPDSWLSRCKWRPADVETRITQQVLADGEELARIVYTLERPPHGPPRAALLEIARLRRERPASSPGHTPIPASFLTAANRHSAPVPPSFAPRALDPALYSQPYAQPAPAPYTYPHSALFS